MSLAGSIARNGYQWHKIEGRGHRDRHNKKAQALTRASWSLLSGQAGRQSEPHTQNWSLAKIRTTSGNLLISQSRNRQRSAQKTLMPSTKDTFGRLLSMVLLRKKPFFCLSITIKWRHRFNGEKNDIGRIAAGVVLIKNSERGDSW